MAPVRRSRRNSPDRHPSRGQGGVLAERVVPWDAGCQWEPNAPEAVLAVSDIAGAALAVEAHPDDVD